MVLPSLSSRTGEFEHDGQRNAPDKEEDGVIFCQVEHTAQGGDRFFFHVVSPI